VGLNIKPLPNDLPGNPGIFSFSTVKNRKTYSLWLGIFSLFCLSGCTRIMPVASLPTLIPTEYLPTAIALTSQALVGAVEASPTLPPPLPTVSPSPTATPVIAPTETPTPTFPPDQPKPTLPETATPEPPPKIPYAPIQIISPGALSRVISPINLHAFLYPGDRGRVRVELYGEDGRLRYRELFVFTTEPGVQTNLVTEIDFEIIGVAEVARLIVSVDDEYGRPKALAAEDLILLALGDNDINPPGDLLAPIVIQEPLPDVLIQGDKLTVSGLVRSAVDSPLLIELVTTDGKLIVNRLAGIAPEPVGGHRLFAAEIPFKVTSPTWVRIIVSERGGRLPGATQLTSIEVLLSP